MEPVFYKMDEQHYTDGESACFNADTTCYCAECYTYGARYVNCAAAGYHEGPAFVLKDGKFVLADNADTN